MSGGGQLEGFLFHKTVSLENLFLAWKEFKRGKSGNADVQEFALLLEDNVFALHEALANEAWNPGPYTGFYIKDPKLRHIHKASVGDRVVHQALYRVLVPLFERRFIAHSYSSRVGKGTHAGVAALESFGRKASHNCTRPTYALSADIRRFFDSVDHAILERLLAPIVQDASLMSLVRKVVTSFEVTPGNGIPLGNVTSQLFANAYLNPLDQFVKRTLKAKHYVRYCDDFVIVSHDRDFLENLVEPTADFLAGELALDLHPRKLEIRPFSQGIDFLGYVVRPHHRVFRTRTKRRMFKNVARAAALVRAGRMEPETLTAIGHSYRGMLAHSSSRGLRARLDRIIAEGAG